jgi:hypothetical protein
MRVSSFVVGRLACSLYLANAVPDLGAVFRLFLVIWFADLYPIATLANPDAADGHVRRSIPYGKRIAPSELTTPWRKKRCS